MKITILTIFPEMFESVLNASILGRAREQGLIEVECVDIRPFSDRKHKNTDDYPFGGGMRTRRKRKIQSLPCLPPYGRQSRQTLSMLLPLSMFGAGA